MKHILGIDPGTTHSAWILIRTDTGAPQAWWHTENAILLGCLRGNMTPFSSTKAPQPAGCMLTDAMIAIEEITPRRQQFLGQETLDTARWVGRFQEAASAHGWGSRVQLIRRLDVVVHFCGRAVKGADAVIHDALIDWYGPTKAKAVGLKHSPGPLYGVTKHIWQALAVAVYVNERRTWTPAEQANTAQEIPHASSHSTPPLGRTADPGRLGHLPGTD
jgi:hypothetical protein